jgi:hypothetical protein
MTRSGLRGYSGEEGSGEAVMRVPDRVVQWLKEHKGYGYCDRCIKDGVRLTRAQQAQQATNAIASTHGFWQLKAAACYECGETRKITGWRSN